MKRVGSTVIGIFAVLAALAIAPAARADGSPPQVWIDGYQSPTENVFALTAHGRAVADGATVSTATVSLNGTTVASGTLCNPACAEGSVPLSFDTRNFPDGTYDLKVSVPDSAGSTGVADFPGFQIWNDRPTGSSSATLTIGSSVPQPQPQPLGGQPGGSGVLGASAGSCVKPKLSMKLNQKPVRIKHGVPVLVKNKRYRFTGRLTCLIKGKRVSAPKRTRIDLRAIVHGKSAPKAHGSIGAGGKIVFRIASPSSRTLEFRFTGLNGKVTRVRIKVETVKVKKKHKKG
jgi:hypothetical protein